MQLLTECELDHGSWLIKKPGMKQPWPILRCHPGIWPEILTKDKVTRHQTNSGAYLESSYRAHRRTASVVTEGEFVGCYFILCALRIDPSPLACQKSFSVKQKVFSSSIFAVLFILCRGGRGGNL